MKKFLLAALAVYVLLNVLSIVIHGVILRGDYEQLPHLFRPKSEEALSGQLMMVAMIPFALGVPWIYAQGVQRKPWLGQGVRFGVGLWAVTFLHSYLVYFSLQPWPGGLVVKQIVLSLLMALILGLTVAAIYRSEAA